MFGKGQFIFGSTKSISARRCSRQEQMDLLAPKIKRTRVL